MIIAHISNAELTNLTYMVI